MKYKISCTIDGFTPEFEYESTSLVKVREFMADAKEYMRRQYGKNARFVSLMSTSRLTADMLMRVQSLKIGYFENPINLSFPFVVTLEEVREVEHMAIAVRNPVTQSDLAAAIHQAALEHGVAFYTVNFEPLDTGARLTVKFPDSDPIRIEYSASRSMESRARFTISKVDTFGESRLEFVYEGLNGIPERVALDVCAFVIRGYTDYVSVTDMVESLTAAIYLRVANPSKAEFEVRPRWNSEDLKAIDFYVSDCTDGSSTDIGVVTFSRIEQCESPREKSIVLRLNGIKPQHFHGNGDTLSKAFRKAADSLIQTLLTRHNLS